MSNFNIPRTRIETARMEPPVDTQMACIQAGILRLMHHIRDAQSIQHDSRHHEMFDLAEQIAALAGKVRGP